MIPHTPHPIFSQLMHEIGTRLNEMTHAEFGFAVVVIGLLFVFLFVIPWENRHNKIEEFEKRIKELEDKSK